MTENHVSAIVALSHDDKYSCKRREGDANALPSSFAFVMWHMGGKTLNIYHG